MTTLAEIRQQYPQYADLSDKALADALHSKFYSDLPFDDFAKKVGLEQPTSSKAGAYIKAIGEGMTFGHLAQVAASFGEAEAAGNPLAVDPRPHAMQSQIASNQQSIDTSRRDYKDVFDKVVPMTSATMGSLASVLFPPLAAEGAAPLVAGLAARFGPRVLAAGAAGGAGAASNEAANPESTLGSVVRTGLTSGAQMAAAELGGLGIAGMASKLIAPGIKVPYITPMRDKVKDLVSKAPAAAKAASKSVLDAIPMGTVRDSVAKGIDKAGSAARKLGSMASSPIMTDAALPLASALGGPVVGIPVAILKELMRPGMVSRYLSRGPLSEATKEWLRQGAGMPLRGLTEP